MCFVDIVSNESAALDQNYGDANIQKVFYSGSKKNEQILKLPLIHSSNAQNDE